MALTRTTVSAAVAAEDTSITVASATDFTAGDYVKINNEIMRVAQSYSSGTSIPVLRGQCGTRAEAHGITSGAVHGLGSDFASPPVASIVNFPTSGRSRTVAAYGAAGAIALPAPGSDAVAIINGTAALAMTLADPTTDMDGCVLWIVGNGKAAHTVTNAGGWGAAGASYDVATFDANGQNAICQMAANGQWVLLSPMTGTLTAVVPALA